MLQQLWEEFKVFFKKTFFLFLLGLAIGSTGIDMVFARVLEAYETTEVELPEVEQVALDQALTEFIGDEVNGAPLAKLSSGSLIVDMDTIQGFHRFMIEKDQAGEFYVADAFLP